MRKIWLLIFVVFFVSVSYAKEVWTLVVAKSLECGGQASTYTIQFDTKEECETAKNQISSWCKEMYCILRGYNAEVQQK
jgi:hypothetical protein